MKNKEKMEQLNRVELRGNVGSVKLQTGANNHGARITLATNSAYHDKDGAPVIDTQWHNIVAWESRNIRNLEKIQKGDKLYVAGRLRYQKYTGQDGVERVQTDILANKIVLLGEEEPLNMEL
ncbi:MAG: single-stranded DNA-binding protein [Bacteroidales bacterium]|nr:single-stranded DNA-binding protein [Bacteroidales bacterium]